MSSWQFFVITVLSVASARLLSRWLSGPSLNGYKYFLCVVFNCPFGFYYLRIVGSGCMAFQGRLDKSQVEYAIVGWVALICAVVHACSFPTSTKIRAQVDGEVIGFVHSADRVPRIKLRRWSKRKNFMILEGFILFEVYMVRLILIQIMADAEK